MYMYNVQLYVYSCTYVPVMYAPFFEFNHVCEKSSTINRKKEERKEEKETNKHMHRKRIVHTNNSFTSLEI